MPPLLGLDAVAGTKRPDVGDEKINRRNSHDPCTMRFAHRRLPRSLLKAAEHQVGFGPGGNVLSLRQAFPCAQEAARRIESERGASCVECRAWPQPSRSWRRACLIWSPSRGTLKIDPRPEGTPRGGFGRRLVFARNGSHLPGRGFPLKRMTPAAAAFKESPFSPAVSASLSGQRRGANHCGEGRITMRTVHSPAC